MTWIEEDVGIVAIALDMVFFDVVYIFCTIWEQKEP